MGVSELQIDPRNRPGKSSFWTMQIARLTKALNWGRFGFLPEDRRNWRMLRAKRELTLIGGVVFPPFH